MKQREVVYAFIDSQNLNLGTSKNIYKNKLLKFIVPNYKTMSILIKKIFIRRKRMNLLMFLNDQQEKLAI
jgi:hypothetical protein